MISVSISLVFTSWNILSLLSFTPFLLLYIFPVYSSKTSANYSCSFNVLYSYLSQLSLFFSLCDGLSNFLHSPSFCFPCFVSSAVLWSVAYCLNFSLFVSLLHFRVIIISCIMWLHVFGYLLYHLLPSLFFSSIPLISHRYISTSCLFIIFLHFIYSVVSRCISHFIFWTLSLFLLLVESMILHSYLVLSFSLIMSLATRSSLKILTQPLRHTKETLKTHTQ